MKYYLWVLGCAMNYSDAERIGAVLNGLGYSKTEHEDKADLLITIACSVRQKAIDRIYGRKKVWAKMKTARPDFKLILTGCVLEKDKPRMAAIFDAIFEISDLSKLPEMLGVALSVKGKNVLGKPGDYLAIMPTYESNFRAYVPIMTGCNNFCSYCAVPYTRGREKSRPQKEILAETKSLIQKLSLIHI